MIATIIVLALCGVIAWHAIETVLAYRKATGTFWERLKSAFRDSATIAWARLNALSTVAIAALVEGSAWVGAPGVREVIEPWLKPQYMLAYMLVVLIGAEAARRRSL